MVSKQRGSIAAIAVLLLGVFFLAQTTCDVAPTNPNQYSNTRAGSSTQWNPSELLSTTTTGSASRPVIAIDALGNVHIAWVDNSGLDGLGTDADIYFKSWSYSTGQWGQVEVISTDGAGQSDSPALFVADDGDVHVTWEDDSDLSGSGLDFDILYRVRDQTTGTWSATEIVSSESTGDSKHPSLVVDSAENVHVVWDDMTDIAGDGDNELDVFYKARNVATGTWNTTSIVSAGSTQPASEPSIAIDSKDCLHVAYQDYGAPFFIGWPSNTVIAYRSKPAGTDTWSTKVQFHGLNADIVEDHDPQIHVDEIGNKFVVFIEHGLVGSLQGAGWFAKPYNNATNQWLSAYQIFGFNMPGYAGSFSSTLDSSRNLHVVYCYNGALYYRFCNGVTRTWGSIIPLSMAPTGYSSAPSIAARGIDELAIAWDGSSDIYFSSTYIAPGMPVAAFTANPTSLQPGNAVQFTFTGCLGTQPSTVSWDFGDGSPVSSEQDPSHVYTTAGIYTVSLTVIDADLEVDTEVKVDLITVIENQAPTAGFTFLPVAPLVGEDLQFTDTSSDVDGSIVAWQWDFGDGSADSTVQNPVHAFLTADTFTVVLTVTDDKGAISTTSQTITVAAPTLTMHVQAISMSCTKGTTAYYVYTTVTVYSGTGTPVAGVTVSITLRNPKGVIYTASGVTGVDGRVTLSNTCSRTKGTYTATVTNLVKTGWIYDPASNVITSKTLKV